MHADAHQVGLRGWVAARGRDLEPLRALPQLVATVLDPMACARGGGCRQSPSLSWMVRWSGGGSREDQALRDAVTEDKVRKHRSWEESA